MHGPGAYPITLGAVLVLVAAGYVAVVVLALPRPWALALAFGCWGAYVVAMSRLSGGRWG